MAKQKNTIKIDPEICKGCDLCIETCPQGYIKKGQHFNSKGWQYVVIDESKNCTGCKLCAMICPDVAISVLREEDDG